MYVGYVTTSQHYTNLREQSLFNNKITVMMLNVVQALGFVHTTTKAHTEMYANLPIILTLNIKAQ